MVIAAVWIAAAVAAAATIDEVAAVPTDTRLAIALVLGAGILGATIEGGSPSSRARSSIFATSLALALTVANVAYMRATAAPWCVLELLVPAAMVIPAHGLATRRFGGAERR